MSVFPTLSCQTCSLLLFRAVYDEKQSNKLTVLLEAPYLPGRLKPSALLAIDLTKAVADEAIRRKDSIIVAYRKSGMLHLSSSPPGSNTFEDPIIWRGLKSLGLGNTQQNSLLRLAQEGISVYCPHTAVDCTPGGLTDFLVDIVTGKNSP
jgi:hypothetical protein